MDQYILDYWRQDGSKGRYLFERHTLQGACIHFDRQWAGHNWKLASLFIWMDTGWHLIETKERRA